MTYIVTSDNELSQAIAPRLPNAPLEYDYRYSDQLNNILRLYFNQLDKILGQLVATTSPVPISTESSQSADWGMQVARGKVTGASQVNIFAFSDSVKTTLYTLWELTGTTQYAFPASAVTMTLASTSASDNTRATILISGLNSSWDAITETVTLNGVTGVTTTNQFLRINNMIMTSTGTGQTTNVGTITAKNGGVTYSQISIGVGRSQAAVYSVPNGYTMYITSINAFNGDAAPGNAINYQVKTTNNAQTNPVTLTVLQTAWDQRYQVIRNNPFPYTQKTDIQWQYSTASGTHSVGLILQGVLFSNTAA
jgi:hypothetical protein